MATTYTHTRVSVVDSSGNINVLYPQSTASDVMVNRSNVKIPAGVNTIQDLANNLGLAAFLDKAGSDGSNLVIISRSAFEAMRDNDELDPDTYYLIDEQSSSGESIDITTMVSDIENLKQRVLALEARHEVLMVTQSEYDDLVNNNEMDPSVYYLITD